MDRSSIDRGQLIRILVADQPWIPGQVDPAQARSGDPGLWAFVLSELAQVQADRLLDPSWSGLLLDRFTTRQKMVEVGMANGAFEVPGMPVRPTLQIAMAMADIQIVVGPVDLTETHARRWERLEAILTAAQTFRMDPVTFLVECAAAQDWILRLSSDPDSFRVHQREWIDAKHPDVVTRAVQALHAVVREETRLQLGRPNADVRIFVGFPTGDDYWQMRAAWLQAVEIQIHRIWSGQALSTTQAPADDA